MGKLSPKEESHSVKVSQNWSGKIKPTHFSCQLSFNLLSLTLNPGALVPVPSVGEVSSLVVSHPGALTSYWLSTGLALLVCDSRPTSASYLVWDSRPTSASYLLCDLTHMMQPLQAYFFIWKTTGVLIIKFIFMFVVQFE